MGREISHAMWHVGCNSHIGHLLCKDFMRDNKVLYELVRDIQVKFKASFSKLIKSMNGKAVVLACETRWGTTL